jgi:hypothetical protein
MMRKLFILLSSLCLLLVPSVVNAQSGLSADEIERIGQSVVMIVAFRDGQMISTGSGTLVSSSGMIYTNRHVIEGADEYAIFILNDPNEVPAPTYFASVARVSDEMDFAILQIDRDIERNRIDPTTLKLPYITPVGASARRGDEVFIFGYPDTGNGYQVFTRGYVSAVQNCIIAGERMIGSYSTDAEVSSGNSGGLAVNSNGEILGIPSAVQVGQTTPGQLGIILPFSAVISLIKNGGPVDCGGSGSSEPSVEQDEQPFFPMAQISFTCENRTIDNAVEFIVGDMAPGYRYQATVVGLGNYDPVIGVRSVDNMDTELCSQDDAAAARASVDLPGLYAPASSNSASVVFSHSENQNMNISIVVGDYDSRDGEFALILEGMAITSDDFDVFAVAADQQVINNGLLNIYMIGMNDDIDPRMTLVDVGASEDDIQIWTDDEGNEIFCDDAGDDENCWGQMDSLDESNVTLAGGRRVTADNFDSGFRFSLDGMNPQTFYFFTDAYRNTTGDYILVFRVGTN